MNEMLHVSVILLTLIPMVMLEKQPVVHLETGAVQGVYATSAGGRKFSAFKGIPYARPPTGKYRFKEPTPIKRWPGVWNASEYGSSCLQYELHTTEHVTGSEDCLFINIFTPKVFVMETKPLMEVLVFIHGKTFMSASTINYNPIHLMENNIVVVTFNYRFGILGFLSTEDDVVPGNNGLKDQTMALHWIQKNIASFGGNPMKVIVAGSLAGAVSVHYHYLSPLSQGLFQGGVSLGGSALAPWAQAHDARSQTNKLATLLGCSTYSSRDLIDCLRYRPARQIVKQTKHFLLPLPNNTLGMVPANPFGPTVEVMGNSPFINKYPGDSISTGDVQDLPWVTGTTVGNGLDPITVNLLALHQLEVDFHSIAPFLLLYNHTLGINQHQKVSDYIYLQYIGNKSTPEEKLSGFQEMLKDRLFSVDIERSARLMASVNTAPVYFFDVSNKELKREISNLNFDVKTSKGIVFQSGIEDTNAQGFSEDGRGLVKLLNSVLVNFLQTGNPSPTNCPVQWRPLVPNYKDIHFLDIFNTTSIEVKSSLEIGNRRFWDSLPIQDPSSIAYKVKMFSHSSEL